jgi:hypothetical protein
MMRILVLGAGPPIEPPGTLPLWLAERHGKLLVEQIVAVCARLAGRLTFVARREDIRRYHLNNVVSRAEPDALVVSVQRETQVAACTALLCIEHIDPDAPLLILNGNEVLDSDYDIIIREFETRELDGGVVTFASIHSTHTSNSMERD